VERWDRRRSASYTKLVHGILEHVNPTKHCSLLGRPRCPFVVDSGATSGVRFCNFALQPCDGTALRFKPLHAIAKLTAKARNMRRVLKSRLQRRLLCGVLQRQPHQSKFEPQRRRQC
jgi:hypothetical protein